MIKSLNLSIRRFIFRHSKIFFFMFATFTTTVLNVPILNALHIAMSLLEGLTFHRSHHNTNVALQLHINCRWHYTMCVASMKNTFREHFLYLKSSSCCILCLVTLGIISSISPSFKGGTTLEVAGVSPFSKNVYTAHHNTTRSKSSSLFAQPQTHTSISLASAQQWGLASALIAWTPGSFRWWHITSVRPSWWWYRWAFGGVDVRVLLVVAV